MSTGKRILQTYSMITDGDMSGDITGTAVNIQNLDNLAIQLVFTGTPTGTFSVQGSVDNSTYIDVTLSPSPVASGSGDSILINMNNVAFTWIRVKYNRTSGTGTLNANIVAKAF